MICADIHLSFFLKIFEKEDSRTRLKGNYGKKLSFFCCDLSYLVLLDMLLSLDHVVTMFN